MFGGLVNHTYQQQNTSTLVHFCYATGCCFHPFISVLSCITLVYWAPKTCNVQFYFKSSHKKAPTINNALLAFIIIISSKHFLLFVWMLRSFVQRQFNECNSFKILPFPRSNYSLIVFHFHRCPVMKISRQCFKLPVVCLRRYLEANNEIDQPISDVACQ